MSTARIGVVSTAAMKAKRMWSSAAYQAKKTIAISNTRHLRPLNALATTMRHMAAKAETPAIVLRFSGFHSITLAMFSFWFAIMSMGFQTKRQP